MKRVKRIEDVAEELGMITVRVPSRYRDKVWNWIAINIDRLRPGGFDGHVIVCASKDTEEVRSLIK